jgi:hypothetical protein
MGTVLVEKMVTRQLAGSRREAVQTNTTNIAVQFFGRYFDKDIGVFKQ